MGTKTYVTPSLSATFTGEKRIPKHGDENPVAFTTVNT